jgi:predicted acylesterase/phospholipase RssA
MATTDLVRKQDWISSSPLICLNLAPGGAKGAYQAGALLRLAEKGIRFDRVLGSSIGALNGAFYVQGTGSPEEMTHLCKVWLSLPETFSITMILSIISKMSEMMQRAKTFESAFASLFEDVLSGRDGFLGDMPLVSIVDSVIDYKAVCRSPKELIIATMEGFGFLFDVLMAPAREPVYLSSFHLDGNSLRRALLASASIPVLFRAQSLWGAKLVDAGWARLSLEPLLVGSRRPSAIVSIAFPQATSATATNAAELRVSE